MTALPNPSRSRRSGFTLVELLVVITVIGILVGLLTAAVIPVMRRAREAAIQFEMKQIEQSVENFRNDYGFYPPTWNVIDVGDDTTSANNLLRFINRIAPNNREGVGAVGSRPVDIWWMTVGRNINAIDGEDLVFWLSGLSKNLQFPLTNTGSTVPAQMPDPYPSSNTDVRNNFERQDFYEFNRGQFIETLIDPATGLSVAGYDQAAGSNSPWLYIDSANYATNGAYHVLVAGTPRYENPNTFQLFCGGIDKDRGDSLGNPLARQWAIQATAGTGYEGLNGFIDQNPEGLDPGADNFRQQVAPSLATTDNICNFCEGRLELLITGVRESQAIQ